ncbi:histidine ammonia-lyase [Melghiribacillus thermohalophilus]|uniref:Histidine ammonia-lyase n=1 Tax=Melghiribacillus thermohalophilus TaxID=1324956 RepID=A0A4V2V1E6_9BACI|nr:histidine ammonia-lyase [Melghiribacillus thermohalophilus]TCT20912.1 histidine ammonia-lyase [Melghiribacillus thermohalophilus]
MITLTGNDLTVQEVERVVFGHEKVAISNESMEKLRKSRQTIEEMIKQKQVIYGINTGFGKLSDVVIDEDALDDLQQHLIDSHSCGVGEPFSESVSRAMVLLRANALAKGYSGIRPIIVERLIDLINDGIHPVIPRQGSLGASGDLAPLAHLAQVLTGKGEVFDQGKRISAIEALRREELEPVQLKAKEGLALINGTQAMTAVGVIAYLEAEKLALQSELIGAMTLEALRGIIDAFDEDLHQVRGYPEQQESARRIRLMLKDSQLVTRQGELRVQDAYSLRCMPQVIGATWQCLNYVREKLQIEINAATDNPLIFSDTEKVLSGGNFHGQPIALAMDFMKTGIAEIANMAERRVERMVNPQLNDLPPFLSTNPGLQSGVMIMQYTAASLVSENKTLAHPASVDSIPSSANQEDHVSMGTIAARHAYEIIQNVRRVLAIELICAMQAVEIRGKDKMATVTRRFLEDARRIVPRIDNDRVFSKDIEAMNHWLRDLSMEQMDKYVYPSSTRVRSER